MNETAKNSARKSLDKIVETLKYAEEPLKNNSTYETGTLGLSLFYCYYSLFIDKACYFSQAEEYLSKGLDLSYFSHFERVYTSDSMDSHISNIGRFVEFSKKNDFLDIDTNSLLGKLDLTMFELMTSKISISDFDLNSGAMASGYYFLSRMPSNPGVKSNFDALIKGIDEKALKDDDGDYYWQSPSLFNNVYLGLSHGSAMIVSFLATIWEMDIERDLCKNIMRKAVNFIMKQVRDHKYGRFPLVPDDNVTIKPFCQCYGDIGIAYALAKSAHILKDDMIDAIVQNVIKESVVRKYDTEISPYPPDASIVYGASGLASLFEKLSTFNNDEPVYAASQYWYGQITSYAKYENEFAGYRCMFDKTHKLWNLSFGWGIIGIGISLMRYINPDLPPLFDLQMIV